MYATVNDDGINIRKAPSTRASVFRGGLHGLEVSRDGRSVNAFARRPSELWYLHGDHRVVSPIVVRRLLLEERIQVSSAMYKGP
jgi:hypothetical protein